MSMTTQDTAIRRFGGNILLKKNKLIFFVLNLLLVGPYILARYSPIGWALSAALLLVMFYFIVLKPGVNEPVVRNLPLLVCFDACIPPILIYQLVIRYFTTDNVKYALEMAQQKVPYVALLVVGLILGFIRFKDPLLVWMKGLSKTIIGAAVLLLLWSDGSVPRPNFAGDSGLFFRYYLLFAAAWCVLCAISYYVDNKTLKRNNWLSWLLLAALVAACLLEAGLVYGLFGSLHPWNLEWVRASLDWWKIALLVYCAILTYNYKYICMGADSLFLGALAGGALVLRVLISHRFPLWQLLPLAFLAGTLYCLKNELRWKKTLRLSSPVYLVAQTGAALLVNFLIYKGLWYLLILYGAAFYVVSRKKTTPGRQTVWWLTILSFPPVLAAALSFPRTLAEVSLWQASNFMVASYTLLAAAYVVLALAIVILNRPHPDGQTSPGSYKWAICGFMAVLSCLTAFL